jgi:hypothetical protein
LNPATGTRRKKMLKNIHAGDRIWQLTYPDC